jgi:hypothetical protein
MDFHPFDEVSLVGPEIATRTKVTAAPMRKRRPIANGIKIAIRWRLDIPLIPFPHTRLMALRPGSDAVGCLAAGCSWSEEYAA